MTYGDTAATRLDAIARASASAEGVTRLPWTEHHRAALDQIAAWMTEAGLYPALDAAGTLVGRSPNPDGKPVLMIGSHQDSVPTGGGFDGIMGIALGCLVAEALKDRLPALPFALEILAFADEEGVRFPTALIGPRALAGTLKADALDMTDVNDVAMRDAMRAFGVAVDDIGAVRQSRGDVVAYLEAHIEQGPVLEAESLPVAAVSAICGISRFEIRITGETGHAGTVPMAGRRDALVAASRIIAAVSDAAVQVPDLRATVGTLALKPGAVNAIPSEVRFPLEIRAPQDTLREAFETEAMALARDICFAANCDLKAVQTYAQPAAVCDLSLRRALETAIGKADVVPLTIPSGATHDASAMADLCPIAMLFVRCRGGISHRPDEFASAADMDVAVRVMVDAILGYEDDLG
ncbi:M20 family metallo-hydrolase [Sagittula stellata]|uniref:N-carbamoyl-L-amino acid amidohydrolase n=1 Tax=Sagittula stellata (strain ATCC 700073 / DSM 11524 / E-37) TaxID=388399 RepID=A3JY36_SAGS3|nr:M20 family metallo-hydrolase [Sagittula stellata]EBA10422.1 N-carbamoyl-L-amino acid amidohydrolase [Sagittula stellata E-37]